MAYCESVQLSQQVGVMLPCQLRNWLVFPALPLLSVTLGTVGFEEMFALHEREAIAVPWVSHDLGGRQVCRETPYCLRIGYARSGNFMVHCGADTILREELGELGDEVELPLAGQCRNLFICNSPGLLPMAARTLALIQKSAPLSIGSGIHCAADDVVASGRLCSADGLQRSDDASKNCGGEEATDGPH